MGYDIKTGKYTFDFDSVDFPIRLSENVVNYLYIRYKGDCFNFVSIEEFKDILTGQFKTQNACKILSALCNPYNGHRELPPQEFDILTDEISKTELIKKSESFIKEIETHQGVCKFNDLLFDFEYTVEKTTNLHDQYTKLLKNKTTVVHQGDSFKVTLSYMHEACSTYFQKKKEYEEKIIRKRIEEEDRKKWIEFRIQHEQELIDWLTDVIGEDIRCSRVANPVKGGFAQYSLVESLDRGICPICSKRSPMKEEILEPGTHSSKWYELGIDKLNITT